MEKLYSHNALVLLFLLHRLSSLQLLSSGYTPAAKYFINCGSNSNFNLSNRSFLGDENYGTISFTRKSRTDSDHSPTRNSSPLYQTARVFNRTSFYKFSIDRNGTYLVRLHFYAFSSKTNLASAVFNVTARFDNPVPGFALLSKFSVQNSSNSPVIKEFFITINPKKFRITFVPYEGTSLAFVNALEVFLAPESFIPNETPHVTRDGESNITYGGLLSQALQTVHRINVGGASVGSDNDALWRNWTTDDQYLLNPNSTTAKSSYDDRLKYSGTNATEEMAPGPVYKTSRYLILNSNFTNMTWRFDVNRNSRHLVRMHFCDILSVSENLVDFNLSIYDKLIERIDPYQLSFGVRVPFCLDFVVDSDESGFMGISVGHVDEPPFLNGVEILKLVEKTPFVRDDEPHKTHRLALIVGLAASSVAIVISILLLLLVVMVVLKRRKAAALDALNLKVELKIPFSKIKRATKNFDKKKMIGEGGFGKVYIGTLDGVKVAVKRGEAGLDQGFLEFQTEITILSKISHRRLVSLMGYCNERSEMILVYEFMEQGTLRDHLYSSKKSSAGRSSTQCSLSWKQRLEICIHSAEGLNYLHTSSDGGIIHRDVKSTNILLDEHFNAKVADFGISRIGQFDQPYVSTNVKGSFGYLDPEYFGTQQLTKKSDVYSFGVVLLEVLCARPAVDTKLHGEQTNLAEWAMSWQKRGQLEAIIDPRLGGDINPTCLRKLGETAEKCLRECGADRPNMEDVLWELQYVYALEFQQSATQIEACEDSTTNAWLQWPSNVKEHLPSHSFSIDQKDDVLMSMDNRSETTASEVFSQLKIDAPR